MLASISGYCVHAGSKSVITVAVGLAGSYFRVESIGVKLIRIISLDLTSHDIREMLHSNGNLKPGFHCMNEIDSVMRYTNLNNQQ